MRILRIQSICFAMPDFLLGRQQQHSYYFFLLIASISTAALYLIYVLHRRQAAYKSKWVRPACNVQLCSFTSNLFCLDLDDYWTVQKRPTQEVARRRKQYVGYNTTLLYTDPLHIVEGKGCKLYSAEGREYLDCANNVAHVGHSHSKVRSLANLDPQNLAGG